MSADDTLVLAWHGSRKPAGKARIAAITDAVAARLPGVTVHTAWVDIEPELLPQTLARAGDCTLVPCFLAAGYHVTHDVPQAVASVPHDVRVTPHLGGALHRALLDRVAEAGGPGAGVVLAAAGSQRAQARAEVAAVAARLADALGVDVRVGNVYLGEPSVDEVVGALRQAQGPDVLVLPYTLAPGLWSDRIAGLGVRVAAPLGHHPDVVGAIVARYRTAARFPHRLLLTLES